MKICKKCKVEKDENDFYKSNKNKCGLQSQCKNCANLNNYKWKRNNPDNVKKINAKQNLKRRWNTKNLLQEMKIQSLFFYSNGKMECDICGESDIDVLDLDHINNGGGKHRKEIRYRSIGVWCSKNNFPDGFRVLCRNCNWKEYLKNKSSKN